jgi:protease PrsW
MAQDWYYLENNQTCGPVDFETIQELIRQGGLHRDTLVWHQELTEWTPASAIEGLDFSTVPPPPPPPPKTSTQAKPAQILRHIGAKISELTDLPEITDIPILKILFGQMLTKAPRDLEDEFIVGTRQTTPALAQLETGWPHARLCWRVLAGSLATYFLLQFGWSQFHNPNRIPAMMVVGSFIVPLTVVIFFFEMNTPRNISAYQIIKLLMLGGALSIISNAVLGEIIPGTGTGMLVPSFLTGIAEETAKALPLLLVLFSRRYSWQLNGLMFGAAVGAGFAGFESAGYAFKPIWQNPGLPFDSIVELIQDNITLRGLLAPGGHVIWTAMVASGLWKAKGDRAFSFAILTQPLVFRRWVIAVILHGLWDADILVSFLGRLFTERQCSLAQCLILSFIGWYIVFASLKQALSEVASARLAALSDAQVASR